MKKIVRERSTGKTKELIEYAKGSGAIIVCADPRHMEEKISAYGATGVQAISYYTYIEYISLHDLFNDDDSEKLSYVIDDADLFMSILCPHLTGFTMVSGEN